jgi:hypothetical protein
MRACLPAATKYAKKVVDNGGKQTWSKGAGEDKVVHAVGNIQIQSVCRKGLVAILLGLCEPRDKSLGVFCVEFSCGASKTPIEVFGSLVRWWF